MFSLLKIPMSAGFSRKFRASSTTFLQSAFITASAMISRQVLYSGRGPCHFI